MVKKVIASLKLMTFQYRYFIIIIIKGVVVHMTQERKEVSRTRFSTSVDKKLLETLDELSKETRIPKSKLVDTALEMLFEKYQIEESNK